MSDRSPALPSSNLLKQQADWLAPARAVLLRRAAIAHRRAVLDLGAGIGVATSELVRRSSGLVYALDRSLCALHEVDKDQSVVRIAGDACDLPLAGCSMDLVFSQFTLLWTADPAQAISELWRVLKPGGQLCAIEPDYHGLIEYPPATAVAEIWHAALGRSDATSNIGRQLPALLDRRGFRLQVHLLDQLRPPSPQRFAMLRELPLEPTELVQLASAEEAASHLKSWQQVAHLPLFLINASRPV